MDVYGSSGDYLGSGMDGMEMHVHGNAQDQLGQVLKSGKLVIHGDAGQTFMYGAKGGMVYVSGNAAGGVGISSGFPLGRALFMAVEVELRSTHRRGRLRHGLRTLSRRVLFLWLGSLLFDS